jgi:cytidyltransferase-like protein
MTKSRAINSDKDVSGKTVVITCGYFNPVHPGHIECFTLAKALGDELWVIVNNDTQAELKRSVPSFQDHHFRMNVVSAFSAVDKTILSIDTDASVVKTLRQTIDEIRELYPASKIIFAKGGDRFSDNIPEKQLCDECGVTIVDGLGAKTHSSSEYVSFKQTVVAKDEKEREEVEKTGEELALEVGMRPWGHYVVIEDKEHHKVKRLVVEPGHRLSLQSHTKRKECWVVVSGIATVEIDGVKSVLEEGESIIIKQGEKHRLSNTSKKMLEIVEVQYGTYTGEDDIVRYEDDYARV